MISVIINGVEYIPKEGSCVGTMKDIDGNIYKTAVIDGKEWMLENLKVGRFRNGEAITNITDNEFWVSCGFSAKCSYDNDVKNKHKYGCLYNWLAVDDSRGLAPEGWRIPTIDELSESVIKNPLFSARPGGYRNNNDGTFNNVGNNGNWWSSTENNTSNAYNRNLNYNNSNVNSNNNTKSNGYSVRCLRDLKGNIKRLIVSSKMNFYQSFFV